MGSGALGRVAALAFLAVGWGDTARGEEARFVGGSYDVHGTVTGRESGERRAISGTVIIDQQGSEYRSTYYLRTRVKKEDGSVVHADVLGRGEGKVVGDQLIGKVETQLILATVPGAYGTAPYVPRHYGPVILQDTRGKIDKYGVLTIETEYKPVEGGPPEPSTTWLQGERGY